MNNSYYCWFQKKCFQPQGERQIEYYNLNRFLHNRLYLLLTCFYHNAELCNYQYLFLGSNTEASSLDSEMLIMLALVDFAI